MLTPSIRCSLQANTSQTWSIGLPHQKGNWVWKVLHRVSHPSSHQRPDIGWIFGWSCSGRDQTKDEDKEEIATPLVEELPPFLLECLPRWSFGKRDERGRSPNHMFRRWWNPLLHLLLLPYKYEALIKGLQLVLTLKARRVSFNSYSQVQGAFKVKEETMQRYLAWSRQCVEQF